MYKYLTASYLTEGLGNIMYNKESKNKFQKLNQMMFEWNIEVNFIKRIPVLGVTNTGLYYDIAFPERYYEKYDTFQFIDTKQQGIVLAAPVRKADNYWVYTIQLVDNTGEETLPNSIVGTETRFLANIHPELSEEGYMKYQSNVETHRNWISEIRHDLSWSSRYAVTEDSFIRIANGESGGDYKEVIFKMPKIKKDLMDQFMQSRNNALLFGKSTMDSNGKSVVKDPHTGRELIAGDGMIPQLNRFAGFFSYGKLTTSTLNKVMSAMIQKAEQPQGNVFQFVCNLSAYDQIQEVLAKQLAQWRPTEAKVFTQEGGKIKVGAEYVGYSYMGNTINFALDRALGIEYPDRGYAICVDLTADKTSGQPAISMFTLEGGEYIENTIAGVRGLDGKSSGPVASPVEGSKMTATGQTLWNLQTKAA